MDVGVLILRLVVGGLLFGHGTQKLFGWFGGGGLSGAAGMVGSLGFRPAPLFAVLNGLAEAGGGVLLALGLLTPLGAAGIIGVMLAASLAVHLKNGMWNQNGGMELPLTNLTAAAAVAWIGPGPYSLDAVLGLELAGTWWGLGALGLGVGTALIVLAIRRSPAEAEGSEDRRPAA